MTELQILQQWLIRLRHEKLQACHAEAMTASPDTLPRIRALACEADLVQRILSGVKDLEKDPGQFLERNLKP